MAAVTLLETKDLSRSFGGLHAVSNVDFALGEGEVRAIIGPNGAGKTTFVNLLSGRLRPSSGTVTFEGSDISGLPAFERVRRGIAYTFQITSIYPNLPTLENVMIAAQGGGHKDAGASIAERAGQALASVGLQDRAGETAGEMAYGHQRLLEVAMGLALDPTLLILDEPTQGLSDSEIEDFCGLVKEIANKATVLLIEHNMPVVMQLADRITVLNFGEILAEGTPEDIRADRQVQAAYLGS